MKGKNENQSAPPQKSAYKGDRIAKVMARAGLCSLREAERWIDAGRVKLNGKTLKSAAENVTEEDEIIVDGKPLPRTEPSRLFLYHKPAGLVTTHNDEQGRETVFDALPDHLPRVISVGRLDLATEGLLLLTNDGTLSRYMELPSTGWIRNYRVRVHGKINQDILDNLQDGITIEGIHYGAIVATLVQQTGTNSWIDMALTEGKNREIRRVCQHLGLHVNRLIRISYGPFQLGKLEVGAVQEIERNVLRSHFPADILTLEGKKR